jgi:hypothetical protein
MKFKQYIKEQYENDDIKIVDNLTFKDLAELFNKNCKPYFKDFYPIWKGEFFLSGKKLYKEFERKKVRTDRKPKDTPLDIHKLIDNWFYKKFNIKARSNCIFASFDEVISEFYGRLYYLIPIGKYTTIASSLYTDLYSDLVEDLVEDPDKIFMKNAKNTLEKYIEYNLEKGEYKKNKKVPNKRSEYMIICKEYYIIEKESLSDNLWEEILDIMGI